MLAARVGAMWGWLLCMVVHKYPRYVGAYSQAPDPVRCMRCGQEMW